MLVDDHEVVRDGIKALLQAQDDLLVVGEAGSVKDALLQADRTKPDVIMMDVRLADGSGIEATREIRAARPETRVLMLTSFADDEALFASIMAGADGYVLKQIRGGELLRAIRTVGSGQSLLDPAITSAVLDRLPISVPHGMGGPQSARPCSTGLGPGGWRPFGRVPHYPWSVA